MNTDRVSRVLERMRAHGLSQLVISSPYSIDYLIGRHVEPGERMFALTLSEKHGLKLFANRLMALGGSVDVPLEEFDDTDDPVALLSGALDAGVVGVDKFWPCQFALSLMEKRSDLRLVLGSAPVDESRMVKDEEELRLMREASRLNDLATGATIRGLKKGMAETEATELYAKNAKEAGGEAPSFGPLVCWGANCAEPHHSSDDSRLREGDAVILDVGCSYHRYCSDMTRTVFFHSATDEQKRVHDIVRMANEAGRAAVRPGIPLKEIDLAARKVIEDAGYGEYFIHRTGHNIGLEVHEKPDVSSTSEVIARPGMVFSVEPGIYLPGKFGVRVEDLVAVTEDGCETLNHLPREWQIVD